LDLERERLPRADETTFLNKRNDRSHSMEEDGKETSRFQQFDSTANRPKTLLNSVFFRYFSFCLWNCRFSSKMWVVFFFFRRKEKALVKTLEMLPTKTFNLFAHFEQV
jgi:hypothetical protein